MSDDKPDGGDKTHVKVGAGLSPRQAAFVAAILGGANGKQAAIAAGYSESSAESQASRLLRKRKVSEALQRTTVKVVEEAESTAKEVLTELRRVANSDIADVLDPKTGGVLPVHQMPVHARRAVASVKVQALFAKGPDGERMEVGSVTELKFWNKNEANGLLAKKHGLLVEKVEHSTSASLSEILALVEARRRGRR